MIDSYKSTKNIDALINGPSEAFRAPLEEILISLLENENSPRRNEIKVRKYGMKLRKNEIEVPMSFFFPR